MITALERDVQIDTYASYCVPFGEVRKVPSLKEMFMTIAIKYCVPRAYFTVPDLSESYLRH